MKLYTAQKEFGIIWNFSDPYFTAFTFTGKLQWKTSFCAQCGIKMTDT